MEFTHHTKVRFDDVDVARIVFYPRVFRYVHEGIEDWLEQQGTDFRWMKQQNIGIPIVHAESDFHRPLRYGERIRIEYRLEIGPGSLRFRARGYVEQERAFEAEEKRATIDLESFTSIPVPDRLRSRLTSSG